MMRWSLLVSKCVQGKRKQEYTSLFIKHLQTVFLKPEHTLQYDLQPWKIKGVAKCMYGCVYLLAINKKYIKNTFY